MAEYYYFGKKDQVRYNPESKKVCPSDWWFIILTLILIIGPTALAYFVILGNEELEAWIIIILLLFETGSIYLCLWALYSAATTEPGIIPKIESRPGDYVVAAGSKFP